MICLVTGATGFIGQRLCAALQARGHTVVAALRSRAEGAWDRVVRFDLVHRNITAADLEGVRVVFHLAGKAHALAETRQDGPEYRAVNALGTRRLLEVSREAGVEKLIYFSTVKVMGENVEGVLDESCDCCPQSPYGASKLEGEILVLEGGYVPEAVVLRLSMVYGPTLSGNLSRMIYAVDKGHFPPLPEVANKRSMVHVDDVVRAALLAMERSQASNQTYIISDGNCYSTRQIYLLICAALHKRPADWTLPIGVLRVIASVGDMIGQVRGKRFMFDTDAMDKLIGSAYFSADKINRELGFRPMYDLASALPEIVSYLQQHDSSK